MCRKTGEPNKDSTSKTYVMQTLKQKIVSKAAKRSRRIRMKERPLDLAEGRSSVIMVRAVWVECVGWKPDFRGSREELGEESQDGKSRQHTLVPKEEFIPLMIRI